MKTTGSGGTSGLPYVPAVTAQGTLLFVSGQIPTRNGELVTGNVGEQTELVMENIAAILRSAGATVDDIVRCGVALADLNDLPEFNAAYVRAFGSHLPARTVIGAQLPGWAVEIDCIATVN
ncbi:MAG TPA: RidA family protein [Pseudolysinimonas sp.]|jgi:reactive intermediate/imine deaminase|nr:RidA family protein [Pseudolysinimonas sp.]